MWTKVTLSPPPSPPSDPHFNPPRTYEYTLLYDDSGSRCGIAVKGDVSGWAFEKLCQQEDISHDPGDTRTEKVRWVPVRKGEIPKKSLMPVGKDGSEKEAFTATYLDLR